MIVELFDDDSKEFTRDDHQVSPNTHHLYACRLSRVASSLETLVRDLKIKPKKA